MSFQRTVFILLIGILFGEVLLHQTAKASVSPQKVQSPSCSNCCQGPPGPPGNNGLNGQNGIAGKNGQAGRKGDKGDRGLPGMRHTRNWRQCAWTGGHASINTGLVKECEFVKKADDTALRVVFQGNFHSTTCARCCKRWFITFNGAQCSGPLPIDAILYILDVRKTNSPDYHNQAAIEGYCENIRSGRVRVGINLDNCPGYTASSGATGWNSVSRLIIEEVSRSQ